jgi:hypothetical protein
MSAHRHTDPQGEIVRSRPTHDAALKSASALRSRTPGNRPAARWTELIVGAALLIGVFTMYATLSDRLAHAPGRPFELTNALFQLDAPRVIGDMTVPVFDHSRTKVHPLFVILVNPIGSLIAKARFLDPSTANRTAAIFLNSLFGALSILLAYSLFRRMGGGVMSALALALAFAMSMSQLFLSIVPETPSLATLSLLTTYSLFWSSLNQRRQHRWLWIAAGLFSIGVTTTNFLQTLVCFIVSSASRQEEGKCFRRLTWSTLKYVLVVLFIASLLAVAQKLIYPSSKVFFGLQWYIEEKRFLSLLVLAQPLAVARLVFWHFLAANVVGPPPHVFDLAGNPAVTFSSWPIAFSPLFLATLLAWGSLAVFGVFMKTWRRQPWFFVTIIACVAINLAIHSFYGEVEFELFLYTGNFTFLIMLLLLNGYLFRTGRAPRLVLAGFVVLLAANNLSVVRRITAVYRNPQSASVPASLFPSGAVRRELAEYRHELELVRSRYGTGVDMPTHEFFLFGMGDRTKLVYRNGTLSSATNGEVLRHWDVAEQCIIPPAYLVALRTRDGEDVTVREDSEGIWLTEGDSTTALGRSRVALPSFSEYRYPAVMRVLHQEMLINVVDGAPRPCLFTYSHPRYRDAAMVCVALARTGNLHLVHNWILGLSQPYDFQGGEAETDNLGQALYLISLVSDKSHPLVNGVLAEMAKQEEDGHMTGQTDGSPHPVYQTRWAKFGLRALGLNDPYVTPVGTDDDYGALCWWDSAGGIPPEYVTDVEVSPTRRAFEAVRRIAMRLPGLSEMLGATPAMTRTIRRALKRVFGTFRGEPENHPYINWARGHSLHQRLGQISDRDYPLTWEGRANAADYEGMRQVAPEYVNRHMSAPHAWHAAEAFLRLMDEKPGASVPRTPGPQNRPGE